MSTRRTVILADDDPLIRELLRLILRTSNYNVVAEASHGDAVLALNGNLHPDIVLLDIAMPGMDGLSVLKALRAASPACRVVMISGGATADRVREALALGASGFIVKPFTPGKLLDELEMALGPRP